MRTRNRLSLTLIFIAIFFSALASASPPDARHYFSEKYHRPTNVKTESFFSRILNREIRYSVYLPPSYFREPDREFPAIYYFHGFDVRGTAYEDWLNWHLDEALDALIGSGEAQEMIVAMPECFYTGIVVNWGKPASGKLPPFLTFPFRVSRGAFRSAVEPTYLGTYLFLHQRDMQPASYADFFRDEFVRHIETCYRTADGSRSRALCGFSTGGYSALSIAFQNPDMFDSVSSHAPMLVLGSPFSPNSKEIFVEFDPEKNKFVPQRFTINLLRRIFVEEQTWQENDPVALARRRDLSKLKIYVDVAEQDKRKYDLGVRELVAVLEERGISVHCEFVRGLPTISSHTYPGFLNGRLIAALAFGKSEKELRREFGWNNLRTLLNPEMQQIAHSLKFHSREFSGE